MRKSVLPQRFIPVVLLLLLAQPTPASAQSSANPAPPMSEDARAYLTEALDSLQAVAMRRATTDWQAVRDSAFLLAAGAQRPDQTYGALNWALRRVDRHSSLQARFPWVNPETTTDAVARRAVVWLKAQACDGKPEVPRRYLMVGR